MDNLNATMMLNNLFHFKSDPFFPHRKTLIYPLSVNTWKCFLMLVDADESYRIHSCYPFQVYYLYFCLSPVRNVHYRGCFKLPKSTISTFPVHSFQPNLTTQSCIETCTDKVWMNPLEITELMINLLHIAFCRGDSIAQRAVSWRGILRNIKGWMCL